MAELFCCIIAAVDAVWSGEVISDEGPARDIRDDWSVVVDWGIIIWPIWAPWKENVDSFIAQILTSMVTFILATARLTWSWPIGVHYFNINTWTVHLCWDSKVPSLNVFNSKSLAQNFADDYIWTAELWCRKRPFCQLCHKKCEIIAWSLLL